MAEHRMMMISQSRKMDVISIVWLCLFIVLATNGVGTETVRHPAPSSSGKDLAKLFSGDVWKYLSALEQSTSKRFDQMETRLTRKMDERIQMVNQSTSIAHLETLLHHVNEELAISRDQTERNEDLLEQLRRRTDEQQTEIDELKRTVTELQRTVTKLLTTSNKGLDGEEVEDGEAQRMTGSTTTTQSTTATSLPIDCQEAHDRGDLESPGFYYPLIKPQLAPDSFKVCCYVNNSGWTVIQRRIDGSVDFYRDWNDYKDGFGDVEGEFWLGNDHIYHLTNQGDYRLRIEMTTWDDDFHWVEYRHFSVSDETDKYRLHVTGYRGTAGNSLSSPWDNDHNGQQFSTRDSDNDDRFYDNCAEHFRGAWWFRSCFQAHLNGVYYPKGMHSDFFVRDGIQWNSIHPHSSLKQVTMMVRPNQPADSQQQQQQHLSNGIEQEAPDA